MRSYLQRWKYVLILTLTVRLTIFSISLFNNLNQSDILYYNILSWIRWDGPHYIDIAKIGYQTSGDGANFIVFYPLYPALIKIMTFLTADFNLSSILISLICSFISSILLYELALIDFSKKVAMLSVWFLNIFPTSYFLQASYTESLFLSLSLLSIYFYRKQTSLAGISGLFTSLTRINGLTLIPYYLSELFSQKVNWKRLTSASIVSFLTLSGFLIYLFINKIVFGDFFYFIKPLSEHWYKNFEWPWIGITKLVNFISYQDKELYFIFLGELLAIIFSAFFTILTLIKIRLSYGVYMLTNLILFTSTNFIMSTPRYMLILFPIYFALGKINNKLLIFLTSIIFIGLLIYLSLIYTQGKWAY